MECSLLLSICLTGWFCFTCTNRGKAPSSFILIQRSSAYLPCLHLTPQGPWNERQAHPPLSNPAGMTGPGWIAECHLSSVAANLPNATVCVNCGRHFADADTILQMGKQHGRQWAWFQTCTMKSQTWNGKSGTVFVVSPVSLVLIVTW